MEKVNDRIRAFYKSMNISLKDFCENVGLIESSTRNMFNRGTSPSFDILEKIANAYPNLSMDWLITGKGNIDNNESNTLLPEKVKGAIPYYADLPVSAGQNGLSAIAQEEQPTGYMLIPNISAESLFPVIGCSMLPRIKAGDVVGVNRVNRWDRVDPDKIYMIITNEERMIKRLRIDNEDDSILWCVSENYREFKICKSEIINIFHVVYHGELV